MEFQFFDNKLNVDLTNMIASFVGPNNKKHIEEIDMSYYLVELDFEEDDDNNLKERIINYLVELRNPYYLRHRSVYIDAMNVYETYEDEIKYYYFKYTTLKRKNPSLKVFKDIFIKMNNEYLYP